MTTTTPDPDTCDLCHRPFFRTWENAWQRFRLCGRHFEQTRAGGASQPGRPKEPEPEPVDDGYAEDYRPAGGAKQRELL